MSIKHYEETEVNHVSELVLVMGDLDSAPTEGSASEVKKPTVST